MIYYILDKSLHCLQDIQGDMNSIQRNYIQYLIKKLFGVKIKNK